MANRHPRRVALRLESLEGRQLPAGHILFNPLQGVVAVLGTRLNDRLSVSYAAGGAVRVSLTGGARQVRSFALAQVAQIDFFGNGGHDRVVNGTSVPVVTIPGGPPRAARGTPAADGSNLLTPDELLIFRQMNAARVGLGLAPLRVNPLLQLAAQNHANNMAALDRYGDTNTDGHILFGHDFVWRVDQTGYRWSVLGENVAYNWGYSDPGQTLYDQWWTSPEHQANMLNAAYVDVGIGVATSASGKTYGVQDFGRPL